MPVTLPAGFTIDTQLSPDRVRVQWPAIPVAGTVAPSIADSTYTQLTALTTSHLVNYPATVNAGDLLVMVVGVRASGGTFTGSISAVAGWTQMSNVDPPFSPDGRAATFYRIAAGNEGGTTVNVPTTVALSMVAAMFRIQAGSYSGVPSAAANELTPSISIIPPPCASGAGAGVQSLYIAGGVDMTGNIVSPTAFNAVGAFNTNTTYNAGPIHGIHSYAVLNSSGTFADDETASITFPSNRLAVGFNIGIRPGSTAAISTLPNLNFEAGDVNWLKGNGWAISTGGLVEAGARSAKFTGIGQSNIVHETLAPVTAGTTITASARISKGNNRQDFAGGAVVLQWFDNTLASLGFNVGNVVNTGTSAFQTSSVTASAPTGAAYVRLAASATRDVKGRATDVVTVDTLSWNHTFTLGGTGGSGGGAAPVTGPQTFTFRVRDANGCEAVSTRTINQA